MEGGPDVPLKGWDRVAAWAGRNSRSRLCVSVALVGDYMGTVCVGESAVGDKWGGLWGRGGEGGLEARWSVGVRRFRWPPSGLGREAILGGALR